MSRCNPVRQTRDTSWVGLVNWGWVAASALLTVSVLTVYIRAVYLFLFT